VFLDQVVDSVREALTGQLGGAAATWPLADLVAVARRLAAIDPSRASIGGLRFQLELALLEGSVSEPQAMPRIDPPAEAPQPIRASKPAEPMRSTRPVDSPGGARPAASAARSHRPAEPAHVEPALVEPAPVSPGLAELIAAWPLIVAELSSSPPIKPLVEACRPIELTDNQVILGFPEGKAFLRDVAERRRTHLEEGIGRVLGRAVAVRLVATNLDLLPAPAAEEVDLLSMARRVFADDLVDADEVR
jgi:hypothetical protein